MFFISIVMAITASSIMFFTHRDVGEAMRMAEKSSAQNVLNLVGLNIKGGYDKLLADRYDTVIKRRKQLMTLANMTATVLKTFNDLNLNGKLSDETTTTHLMKWFRHVPVRKGSSLFIFDQKGMIIAHQDEQREGVMIDEIRDMKGRNIVKVMRYDALTKRGESAVFQWKDSVGKKLGFFLPFRELKWTIVAMTDISDIEAESQKKLDKIINILDKTFAAIKIEKTGSVFLFTGKKDILIQPRGHEAYHLDREDTTSGKKLLNDIIDNYSEGFQSIQYNSSPDETGKTMVAYISYFKALDWYIALTVPVEEIQEPAQKLLTRPSKIGAFNFFASLLATYLQG